MTNLLPPIQPRVALATHLLLPLGSGFAGRVAAYAGAQWLDLDYAAHLVAPRLRMPPDHKGWAPNALWLPAEGTRGPIDQALRGRFVGGQGSLAPLLIVDAPWNLADAPSALRALFPFTQAVERAGVGRSVAVGLRARHLSGGRRHLTQLTLLRHIVEEWGLDIALDLTGPFDPQWEAEAAVLRMGPRLVLVRAGAAAVAASPVDRGRVAKRALRAAIEQQPRLCVSLAPDVPWWQAASPTALGRAWSDSARRLAALMPGHRFTIAPPFPASPRPTRGPFPPR
ncbi:MAG: hypothetical protein IT337_00790 [Thermomicrobiales bacterium]|nr:hypothetical protein [Thermomicrobiales bacterium]